MTAGETLAITGLASGTTVNLLGEVTFGVSNWAGPLFEIGTSSDSGTFTLLSTATVGGITFSVGHLDLDPTKATHSTDRVQATGTAKALTAVSPNLWVACALRPRSNNS